MRPKKSPANQSLAKVIRQAREKHGHTQAAVAVRAGLSTAYYSAIERGEMNPTVDTLLKVTVALGMTASELFGRAQL
jgi:transcriptional regulator with XRE-family HTH domain